MQIPDLCNLARIYDCESCYSAQKWTPVLRFFPKGSPKRSILMEYTIPQDADPLSNPDGDPKIVLPTLLQLLEFVTLHSDGRLVITDAARYEAEVMEHDAQVLEQAYEQTMQYMELWYHINSIAEGQQLDIAEGAATPEAADAHKQIQAIAEELRTLIIDAYKYLVEESTGGTVPTVTQKLQAVADLVNNHGLQPHQGFDELEGTAKSSSPG
jgi:hypothetical protein